MLTELLAVRQGLQEILLCHISFSCAMYENWKGRRMFQTVFLHVQVDKSFHHHAKRDDGLCMNLTPKMVIEKVSGNQNLSHYMG